MNKRQKKKQLKKYFKRISFGLPYNTTVIVDGPTGEVTKYNTEWHLPKGCATEEVKAPITCVITVTAT
jgi:hypothetical protein